jgi:hypothetical protein
MPSRRFPKPWSVEQMPSGYQVVDANGIVLAHVYGQPDGAIAVSDTRLTSEEARRISKLIARIPELAELEKDRDRARSRRKPLPLRSKPVTIGDLLERESRQRSMPAAAAPLSQSRDPAPARGWVFGV